MKKSEKSIFRNDLGWAYYKWDKPDLALEQYDRAINNQSSEEANTGHANFFRGLAHIKKRELSPAKEALEEAIIKFRAQVNLHQDDLANRIFYELMVASALNNLGRIKIEEGDVRAAKRLFQEGQAICEREEIQKQSTSLRPEGRGRKRRPSPHCIII